MPPNLAVNKRVWFIKKGRRETLPVYLTRGIAKRPTRNKQSTPTPYRYISNPLPGSGYTTRESNFTAYPSCSKFWRISC